MDQPILAHIFFKVDLKLGLFYSDPVLSCNIRFYDYMLFIIKIDCISQKSIHGALCDCMYLHWCMQQMIFSRDISQKICVFITCFMWNSVFERVIANRLLCSLNSIFMIKSKEKITHKVFKIFWNSFLLWQNVMLQMIFFPCQIQQKSAFSPHVSVSERKISSGVF